MKRCNEHGCDLIYGQMSEYTDQLDLEGDLEQIEITTDDTKRVLYKLNERQIICPTCGNDDLYINNNKHYRFCPMCGQRLEWWVGTVDDRLDEIEGGGENG